MATSFTQPTKISPTYSSPEPQPRYSPPTPVPSYSQAPADFPTVPTLSYSPTAPSPRLSPPPPAHSFSTHSPTYSTPVAPIAPTQHTPGSSPKYSLPAPASSFSPPAEELTLLTSVYDADPAEDEYSSHQTNNDKRKATGVFAKPPDILFNAEYEWGQRLNRWLGSER